MMENYWFVMMCCVLSALLFFFSSNFVISLVSLFFFTLFSSFFIFLISHNFWGLGLLLIVMITGLFLVFAYIVSINPQYPSDNNWNTKIALVSVSLFTACSIVFYNLDKFLVSIDTWFIFPKEIDFLYKSSFIVSLHLLVLLLFLVVFFMRFTYSKGGSLRKKF